MGGTCSPYGRGENAYRISVAKPQRRRPLGRRGVDGRRIILT